MLKLFRRVTSEEAQRVLRSGFENRCGSYLTGYECDGVWVSDRPLDCNDGVPVDATSLLEVDLALSETDIADFEWVEDGKTYREWLLPADLLNAHARVRLMSNVGEGTL
jgi:hypothetical protein